MATISKRMRQGYGDTVQHLCNAVAVNLSIQEVIPELLSEAKGMMNSCVQEDQWNAGRLVVRRFKDFKGLWADHPPVGDNANASDRKSLFESLDDGQKRGHIGCIAEPHLTTYRLSLIVNDSAYHHLGKIGPVFLAKASLADTQAAMDLEVNRGGFEKEKIQIGEQVPTIGNDQFLDHILVTAERKKGGSDLVADFFT